MKILIYSPNFYPAVGGLEMVVEMLAEEFWVQGHRVKLVCQVPEAESPKVFSFEVMRQPSPSKLLQLTRWCDVFFQPNLSLKGLYPLLIFPKPWVVSHNSWYTRPTGELGWQDWLKHYLTRFATNISVSQAMAHHISVASTVIANPYQQDTFRLIPGVKRENSLVFLGRLVSDKGADLLLEAIANLKHYNLFPHLTIIGDGPELPHLRQQAQTLQITHQVEFAGIKTGRELATLLNAHHILVVPSRWHEPFGIVALEGIACGCVVVGSAGGGLPEAIGPCGITFPNGDLGALTGILANLLNHPDQWANYRRKAVEHLARHQKAAVAAAYLDVFQNAVQDAHPISLHRHAD
jgi:glycosyltransferase involved in cell wall biosynthesis